MQQLWCPDHGPRTTDYGTIMSVLLFDNKYKDRRAAPLRYTSLTANYPHYLNCQTGRPLAITAVWTWPLPAIKWHTLAPNERDAGFRGAAASRNRKFMRFLTLVAWHIRGLHQITLGESFILIYKFYRDFYILKVQERGSYFLETIFKKSS